MTLHICQLDEISHDTDLVCLLQEKVLLFSVDLCREHCAGEVLPTGNLMLSFSLVPHIMKMLPVTSGQGQQITNDKSSQLIDC